MAVTKYKENGNWYTVPSVGTSGGSGGISKETDPTVPAWAKQPNKPTYTADEVGAIGISFYENLADALARENKLNSKEGAKISSFEGEDGMEHIALLDNCELRQILVVDRDIKLMLNNYTLELIDSNIEFDPGTECVIDAKDTGKIIRVDSISQGDTFPLILAGGEKLTIISGEYNLRAGSGSAVAILAQGQVEAKNCTISSTVEVDQTDVVLGVKVQTGGEFICSKSTIISDLPGGQTSQSYGIENSGTTVLRDCQVKGVIAGISNTGNLYVRGGTYDGYQVGGFKLSHTENEEVYIKDALTRCNHYDGQFVGQTNITPLYSVWMTNGNKMAVYFDNCQFGEEDGTTHEAIVVQVKNNNRDGHKLFLSNCKVSGRGFISYSKGSNYTLTSDSFTIKSGINNISLRTNERIIWPGAEGEGTYVDTNDLYRKFAPNEPLNGIDFEIFKTWIDNK